MLSRSVFIDFMLLWVKSVSNDDAAGLIFKHILLRSVDCLVEGATSLESLGILFLEVGANFVLF